MNRLLWQFKKMDWLLNSLVFLLVSLGLLAIYSTSGGETGNTTFDKQMLFVAMGLVGMFAVSFINFRLFHSLSLPLYGIGGILLLLVLLIGTTIRNTTGWIFIGSFGFQPVEFVKLFAIIMLARFFARNGQEFNQVSVLAKSASIILIYIILILAEPDLGSAIVYGCIWFGLLFLVNVRRSHIMAMIIGLVLIVTVSWIFVLQDYQKERVTTLFNPTEDSLRAGYNVTQSILAVGSGQFWGRGFGLGPQSQLKFLPEQQTDFIFAVIAEELGFVGVFLTLALFGTLFFRLVSHARKARDDFSLFLLSGVMTMIFVQVIINIGMNLGIAPVIGIPLPFVSAGGSSLITSLIAIGLVQSIVIHRASSRIDNG